MNSAFCRVAALVSFLSGAITIFPPPSASDFVRGEPDTPNAVEVFDMSSEMTVMVVAAVDLFADSSLELPALMVHGGDSQLGCDGHDGIHRPHAGWSEIELCVQDTTGAVFHTILHELAHAWAAHGLSPERTATFQELREFDFWRNYGEAAWEDNGTEQAAEIIAWGVSDRPAATVRIDHVSCAELHEGYVALTGMEPLHGLTSTCAGASVSRS